MILLLSSYFFLSLSSMHPLLILPYIPWFQNSPRHPILGHPTLFSFYILQVTHSEIRSYSAQIPTLCMVYERARENCQILKIKIHLLCIVTNSWRLFSPVYTPPTPRYTSHMLVFCLGRCKARKYILKKFFQLTGYEKNIFIYDDKNKKIYRIKNKV